MKTVCMTTETTIPPSLPFPESLLDIPVCSTAKVLYARILEEAVNCGLTDDAGRKYIVLPIWSMGLEISRSHMTVKRMLKELKDAGIIRRVRQGAGKPSRTYVLLPEAEVKT